MNIVKIISVSKDSINRNLIKFLRLGTADVQETNDATPFGFDSSPVKDMVAVYAETLDKGSPVIIGYINKGLKTNPGESRIFSTDENGVFKTDIYLKNDGTIEIGGNAKNMVRFQELESGFNQLKSDLNSLISLYNSHIHPTPSGPSSPTISVATSSAASISGAKINEIKTL